MKELLLATLKKDRGLRAAKIIESLTKSGYSAFVTAVTMSDSSGRQISMNRQQQYANNQNEVTAAWQRKN